MCMFNAWVSDFSSFCIGSTLIKNQRRLSMKRIWQYVSSKNKICTDGIGINSQLPGVLN